MNRFSFLFTILSLMILSFGWRGRSEDTTKSWRTKSFPKGDGKPMQLRSVYFGSGLARIGFRLSDFAAGCREFIAG